MRFNREKYLPLATIIFCVVVAIFFEQFFYTPTKNEIFSMKLETRKLQAMKNDLENFKRRYGDLEKFSGVVEESLNEAQEFLPNEPMQDVFVAQLYQIADSKKILIQSVQIGDAEPVPDETNENFFRQSVRINFESDYISILNFLREIIDGKRFVTIENVSIERNENFLIGDVEFFIYHRQKTNSQMSAAIDEVAK